MPRLQSNDNTSPDSSRKKSRPYHSPLEKRDRRSFKWAFGSTYPRMERVFPRPPEQVWEEIRSEVAQL
jgi:hypothetical protein